MKKRYNQTHLQQIFADLERQGLNEVHAAMAHNVIQYRIRGPLPYLPSHKTDILRRIAETTPPVVLRPGMVREPTMAERVELIFKNVGV